MRVPGVESFGAAGRAALALFAFGFLALAAATGSLTKVDAVRPRHLGWLVEHVFVAPLGRTGTVAVLLALGVCAATVAYKWDRPKGDRNMVGFGKRRPVVADMRKQQEILLVGAEELYPIVAGQIGELPKLREEYPDAWPRELDVELIETNFKQLSANLSRIRSAMAASPAPLNQQDLQALAHVFTVLQNSRRIISDTIAPIVMDKMMKHAVSNRQTSNP